MRTKEKLEERSRVLFNSEWVSPELNARNQQEWVKSVQQIGSKWLFAENIKRKILATSQQESAAVQQVLNEFFLETPNGWFHSRCDAEILKFQDGEPVEITARQNNRSTAQKRRNPRVIPNTNSKNNR